MLIVRGEFSGQQISDGSEYLMTMKTTAIGAYPKPEFVKIRDWFDDRDEAMRNPTRDYEQAMQALGDEAAEILARGTREVILDQVNAGIDIPTDGEVRRENYIHYHCRHINGIDFENLTTINIRAGAYADANLPTITGPVSARDTFLPDDWREAQSFTDRPVKITMPGPMTIIGTVADGYYDDPEKLGSDLAEALNKEVLALAEAGARHIQIDEPLFARKPDEALEYGIEHVDRCFHGAPDSVVRTVHICCGYPNKLDNPDFPKAAKEAYAQFASAIDASSIQAVSIEDAHRHNDLSLLENFTKTTVILGVVDVSSSRIETADEIEARLRQALEHIDKERLIAAPDCGLGLLTREMATNKLRNLCEGAARIE